MAVVSPTAAACDLSRRLIGCPYAGPPVDAASPPHLRRLPQAAKSRDQEGSGSQHFSEVMAGFHAGAAEEFRELEVRGRRWNVVLWCWCCC